MGISREFIKARVHVHSKEEIEGVSDFWREQTGLKKEQFIAPLIKKSSKPLFKGSYVINIYLSNSMLNSLLNYWVSKLDDMINQINRW